MTDVLVGLGSNLGDTERHLQTALDRFSLHPQIELHRTSRYLHVAAVGGPEPQPRFLNAVAWIQTALEPQELLAVIQDIETAGGRVRQARWGPRTIDLDLLLYDQRVLQGPDLELPHPWLCVRSFVLSPAAEIAPTWQHPLLQATLSELWAQLSDLRGDVAIVAPSRQALEPAWQATHWACQRVNLPIVLPGKMASDVTPSRVEASSLVEYPSLHRPGTPVRGAVTVWSASEFRSNYSTYYHDNPVNTSGRNASQSCEGIRRLRACIILDESVFAPARELAGASVSRGSASSVAEIAKIRSVPLLVLRGGPPFELGEWLAAALESIEAVAA